MRMRWVVGVSLTLVLLAGCTGAPKAPAPTGAASPSAAAATELVDGDRVRADQVEALRIRFSALPPQEQQHEVAALDVLVERQLWTLSGLEAKLGGAHATDEVFANANRAIRAKLADAAGPLEPKLIGRKGLALPADSLSDATGAGMFGGMMLGGLGSQAASNQVDGEGHDSETQDGITRSTTSTTGTVETPPHHRPERASSSPSTPSRPCSRAPMRPGRSSPVWT